MRTILLPSRPADVGPFCRDLRVRLGIKQADVVYATGSSQSVISSFENGHKMPMWHTVVAYLGALGCQLGTSLTSGEDFPEERK